MRGDETGDAAASARAIKRSTSSSTLPKSLSEDNDASKHNVYVHKFTKSFMINNVPIPGVPKLSAGAVSNSRAVAVDSANDVLARDRRNVALGDVVVVVDNVDIVVVVVVGGVVVGTDSGATVAAPVVVPARPRRICKAK